MRFKYAKWYHVWFILSNIKYFWVVSSLCFVLFFLHVSFELSSLYSIIFLLLKKRPALPPSLPLSFTLSINVCTCHTFLDSSSPYLELIPCISPLRPPPSYYHPLHSCQFLPLDNLRFHSRITTLLLFRFDKFHVFCFASLEILYPLFRCKDTVTVPFFKRFYLGV